MYSGRGYPGTNASTRNCKWHNMETNEQDIEQTITEPQEKYILHIENFEGPLDLLWSLIKRSKIDIVEVSISGITEQYINYLKLMETMNFSIATEFINMASELLYYKSKALLPSGEIDDEFFVPPLPPELIAKLLEYKKYQLSSLSLRSMYDQQSDCYSRDVVPPPKQEGEEEFVTMSLFDLLNAFVGIMSSNKEPEEKEIILDEILVSDRINFIVSLLKKKDRISFREIFSQSPSRAEIIATFLAVLELTKLHKIQVLQERNYGEIHLTRTFSPDDDIGHLSSEFQNV